MALLKNRIGMIGDHGQMCWPKLLMAMDLTDIECLSMNAQA